MTKLRTSPLLGVYLHIPEYFFGYLISLSLEGFLLFSHLRKTSYLHSAGQQMLSVNRLCPQMRKVMFQFQQEMAGEDLFRWFSPFRYLQELHLWGGNFYSDRFSELLETIGRQLFTSTKLISLHFPRWPESVSV